MPPIALIADLGITKTGCCQFGLLLSTLVKSRKIFRVVSSSVSPSSITKVGKEFSARDVREEKIEEARVLPAVCQADQERVLDCLRKKRVFKFAICFWCFRDFSIQIQTKY